MLRFLLPISLIFAISMFSTASAADWTRFRGPNGTGIAEGEMPPIDPKDPLWKVEIPGRGAGSPIIVGGKVFLQTASKDGKTRTLLCLNAADGQTIWSKDVTGLPAKAHAKNSLASSTPSSDGTQVYCVWWDGSGVALNCYDMAGNEKWNVSLGGFVSQHGPGMSPIVHNGMVYVNVDDDERAEFVAFDARTGDKKWVADRKHQRASYPTPFFLKRGDKPEELLLGTTTAITSYDPKTGKVNWNHPISWPAGKMPLRVIGHAVYVGGLIVIPFGDGGGARYMLAIDPEQPTPVKVWDSNKDTVPYVPCMLTRGNLLFWVSDKAGAQACCAEAKTGKILFSERITTKEPSASPIMIGDQILMIAEDGEIVIFKADKEFDEITRTKLGQGVFATPAVADGRIYIRGNTHLFCFGKK